MAEVLYELDEPIFGYGVRVVEVDSVDDPVK